MDSININYIVLAIAMATASGILGSFAIMRKMALASDPISHIALPGLGLAIIIGINPILGAGVALLVGALIVWGLEKRTGISTETMIGVTFSLALAIGAMMATDHELVESLLGNYESLALTDFYFGVVGAILISLFLLAQKDKLTLTILSPDLAKTSGLNVDRLNLYFLLSFVATILIGLKFLGVLLMGSLIIIPAAIGKQLGRSLKGMILISVASSILSTLAGLFIAAKFNFESGPAIITVAAGLFFLSLLAKKAE